MRHGALKTRPPDVMTARGERMIIMGNYCGDSRSLSPTLVLSKASSSVLPLVRKISTALSLSCHQRLCTSLISS